GIFVYELKYPSGELKAVSGPIGKLLNPAFLVTNAFHNPQMLYYMSEKRESRIGCIQINFDPSATATNGLTFRELSPIVGGDAHLHMGRDGLLYGADYMKGKFEVFETNPVSGLVESRVCVFVNKEAGTLGVPERQEHSHAHCIMPHWKNPWSAYGVDLGTDK
ncbi:secreted protein, partial [Reticulomyxa filosa]